MRDGILLQTPNDNTKINAKANVLHKKNPNVIIGIFFIE